MQFDAKHGLIGGGIMVAINLLMCIFTNLWLFMSGALFSFILLIYFMVRAAKAEKLEKGGVLSFREAFSHSWVAFLIMSLVSGIFTYIIYNFIDPTLNERIKELFISIIEKYSTQMGESEAQDALEKIETIHSPNLGESAFDFLKSLVFPGAFIALIIALIVKKESNPFDQNNKNMQAKNSPF